MTEKIIFEFRTIQDDEGIGYEIHHPEEGIKVKMPAEAFERWPVPHPCKRRKISKKRMKRMKKRSRKHMRRNLNFLEELYKDIYGDISSEQGK
jgi:hypothetical protein